jgi:flagellar biosynthesis GTPase FlhF
MDAEKICNMEVLPMTSTALIVVTNGEIQKGQEFQIALKTLRDRAEGLVVRDKNTCEEAKGIIKDGKDAMRSIEALAEPERIRLQNALTELRSQRDKLAGMFGVIVEDADRKRKAWEAEERRKAEEEQRRINEENRIAAQKRAMEERAERERIAAEDRKKREKEAEAARKAGEISKREAERQKKEAAEAEAREKARAAEEAKKTAESAPQFVIKPNIPTVAGVKSQLYWKFEIVDAAALPREFLMADEVRIGQHVRREKEKAQIPGVRVWGE